MKRNEKKKDARRAYVAKYRAFFLGEEHFTEREYVAGDIRAARKLARECGGEEALRDYYDLVDVALAEPRQPSPPKGVLRRRPEESVELDVYFLDGRQAKERAEAFDSLMADPEVAWILDSETTEVFYYLSGTC